ncbi:MAG: PQQ-binding-like beta-propeller repeat protein [Phycisphaerae bacterium]|jgi:outer membrane protein assembly factor BamB
MRRSNYFGVLLAVLAVTAAVAGIGGFDDELTIVPDTAVWTACAAMHGDAQAAVPGAGGVSQLGDRGGYPLGTLIWEYTIDTSWDNSPKAIGSIPDVTGDGIAEVIVCSEDDYVRCFDGAALGTGVVVWEHEIYAGSVYSQKGLTYMDDVDGDDCGEVVVASAWGGRLIRVISGRTGREIWTHDTHEYGDGGWVYQVDCRYDYNGDGRPDVLACTGDDSSDTGPRRVYCLNALNGVSIWERYLAGPVFAVIGVEDFTGDGQPDVVTGASNAYETQGKVYGLDGADGAIEWTMNPDSSSVWGLAQIADITGDSIPDVMVGDFSGNVYGLDVAHGTIEFTNPGFGLINRMEPLGDLNDDGHPDVMPCHSQAVAVALSGLDGSAVWTRPTADKAWNVARSDDITGDSVNDVYVGTLFSTNRCYFLSGIDGAVLHEIVYSQAVDAIAAIPDVTGDYSMEMVAGGRDGLVRCFSGGLDANPCAGQIRGDANCDAEINNFDISPFVRALVDLPTWEAAHPDFDWACVLDINGDGLFNNFDIAPFVDLLGK